MKKKQRRKIVKQSHYNCLIRQMTYMKTYCKIYSFHRANCKALITHIASTTQYLMAIHCCSIKQTLDTLTNFFILFTYYYSNTFYFSSKYFFHDARNIILFYFFFTRQMSFVQTFSYRYLNCQSQRFSCRMWWVFCECVNNVAVRWNSKRCSQMKRHVHT